MPSERLMLDRNSAAPASPSTRTTGKRACARRRFSHPGHTAGLLEQRGVSGRVAPQSPRPHRVVLLACLRAAHPSPRVTLPSIRLIRVLGSPAEPISIAQSALRSHKPPRPASPRPSRSRSTCSPGVAKLLCIPCSARFRQKLPFMKASLPGAFGAIEPPGAGTPPSSIHTRSGGLTSGSSGLAALAAEPRR